MRSETIRAGPELDKLVAEAMGKTVCPGGGTDCPRASHGHIYDPDKKGSFYENFAFSTSVQACAELKKWLQDKNINYGIKYSTIYVTRQDQPTFEVYRIVLDTKREPLYIYGFTEEEALARFVVGLKDLD